MLLPTPRGPALPAHMPAYSLGNVARGQGAHEGTRGSEQGEDSAGVGRVASTLPSLGQAPTKHKVGLYGPSRGGF